METKKLITPPITGLKFSHFFTAAILLISLASGCADNFGSSERGVRYELSLVVVSGNDQVVPSGGIESEPLVVHIVDQRNEPFPGFSVDWNIVQGEGTLSASSSEADSDGYASVMYTSGDSPGDVEVTAILSVGNPDGGAFAGRPGTPVSFDLKVN